MIRRMVYVGCDLCGDPSHPDAMADDASEARARARRFGFRRVRKGGKLLDVCHRHDVESPGAATSAGGAS